MYKKREGNGQGKVFFKKNLFLCVPGVEVVPLRHDLHDSAELVHLVQLHHLVSVLLPLLHGDGAAASGN